MTHYPLLFDMETPGTPIGSYAPDFELPGTDDAVHHLARYLEKYRAVGVIFMCNQCPYVGLYLNRLQQIQTDFQQEGFTLIGINANYASSHPEESFDKMKDFAEHHQLNFPYLRDPTQDVACSFGVERTPEAFLIDSKGVVRYSGSIDDNAEKPEAVQVSYLRNAIAQLLKGEAIDPAVTKPIGCSLIEWRC